MNLEAILDLTQHHSVEECVILISIMGSFFSYLAYQLGMLCATFLHFSIAWCC